MERRLGHRRQKLLVRKYEPKEEIIDDRVRLDALERRRLLQIVAERFDRVRLHDVEGIRRQRVCIRD